jgi:hypothetical protein
MNLLRARSRRPLAVTAALAVLLSVLSLTTGPAGAADNGNFGIEPTTNSGVEPRNYLIYNLDPGSTIQDAVTLSNYTDAPLTFQLYGSDTALTEDGSFALNNPDDPKSGVGAWVLLPTDSITLPPGTEAQIPFKLVVPSDATSGDHAGGIIALSTDTRSAQEGGNVAIDARDGVGVRIYLRVAGPAQPSLDVSSVSLSTDRTVGSLFGAPSSGSVTYKVVNTGNVRLAPTAIVTVKGPFGIGEKTLDPMPLPELLPGARTTISQAIDDMLPLGWQTASVKVTANDADGTPVTSSGSDRSFHVPWVLLLIVVVVVAWFLIRRSRRGGRPAPPAAPNPPRASADALV